MKVSFRSIRGQGNHFTFDVVMTPGRDTYRRRPSSTRQRRETPVPEQCKSGRKKEGSGEGVSGRTDEDLLKIKRNGKTRSFHLIPSSFSSLEL